MSAQANGGDHGATREAQGRDWQSRAHSMHVHMPTGDLPPPLHSVIAELILRYNTIKHMHIPGGRARCRAHRPPIKSESKQTPHDSVWSLPSENNEWLSIFVERTYYISSGVQLNAQPMYESNTLFLEFE